MKPSALGPIVLIVVTFVAPITSAEVDPGFPIVSPELEVTDGASSHLTGATSWWNSTMVRIGNDLYLAYRTVSPTQLGIWVRRLHLDSLTFDPPVNVADFADQADSTHLEPTLLRDAAGGLHVFWNIDSPVSQSHMSRYSYTIPPRYRFVRNPDDPTSWSLAHGTPSRFWNDPLVYPDAPVSFDVMGVYDSRAGVTHLVAEGFRLGPDFDGVPGAGNGGGSRLYYRLNGAGGAPAFDGPWMLVQAAGALHPPGGSGGNVFAKGDLVLGKEPGGQRSLHLAWVIRNTFCSFGSQPDCSGGEPVAQSFNVYYARSDDGGSTWRNLCNSASRRLTEHIVYDDPSFLLFAEDVRQGTERAFDVDGASRPVFVYFRNRAGTGEPFPSPVDGSNHVVEYSSEQYDLVWKRWMGPGCSAWAGGTIEEMPAGIVGSARVRVDAKGNVWFFTDAFNRVDYRVSGDGGTSWSGWRAISNQGRRPYSYPDPSNENYHYIGWQEGFPGKIRLVRLQLTPDSEPDLDADGVPDALDNCPRLYNPSVAPADLKPFQTTTGGQLDDDADGWGNRCDADFDGSGASVDSTDFALFKLAFGRSRDNETDCAVQGEPSPGRAACDKYDLYPGGTRIDSLDFAVFRALWGQSLRPDRDVVEKCASCPLACAGDACPN